MANHPVILLLENPIDGVEPGGLQSLKSQRAGHSWAHGMLHMKGKMRIRGTFKVSSSSMTGDYLILKEDVVEPEILKVS